MCNPKLITGPVSYRERAHIETRQKDGKVGEGRKKSLFSSFPIRRCIKEQCVSFLEKSTSFCFTMVKHKCSV